MNNNNFPRLNSSEGAGEPVKKLPLPPRGGKVAGFPAAPKKPSKAPSAPKAYSPPSKFPIPPQSPPTPPQAPSKPADTPAPSEEPDIASLIVSDEELEDVYAHRGARRVKFLPEDKIYIIATSKDPVVRKELAINPDTPPNILKILSKDEDAQVREEVVFNPSTPKEVYASLVNDPSTWVIEALISNQRTPYKVLEQINVGDDPYLKGLLSKRGL